MVLDSGAISRFVQQEENIRCTGMSDKTIALPYGKTIKATHTVDLPFPTLSIKAQTAHVLLQLTTNSLVSVPKLAEAGYTTVFHPENIGVTIHEPNSLDIHMHKKAILQGWRDRSGLWRLNSPKKNTVEDLIKAKTPCNEHAGNVYRLPSISQSVKFLHAAAGLPLKQTWITAIKNGHYNTWPGLTAKAVCQNFPGGSLETQKGHMKKQCQNVRSTKVREQQINAESIDLTGAFTTKDLMMKVINASHTV